MGLGSSKIMGFRSGFDIDLLSGSGAVRMLFWMSAYGHGGVLNVEFRQG